MREGQREGRRKGGTEGGCENRMTVLLSSLLGSTLLCFAVRCTTLPYCIVLYSALFRADCIYMMTSLTCFMPYNTLCVAYSLSKAAMNICKYSSTSSSVGLCGVLEAKQSLVYEDENVEDEGDG